MRYDPARPVDAEEWSQLDEGEQIGLVMGIIAGRASGFQTRACTRACMSPWRTRFFLGEETPVAAALRRLMGEGLGRHDAIHAIASVLSGVMYDTVTRKEVRDLKAVYYNEVSRLTTEGWRSQAGQT